MKNKLIALTFILSFQLQASAQLNFPNASPDSEFKQQVGFTEIGVKYSRPGAKGRVIFGGLIPYGELWRTGAHDATTISFSDTVKMNGNIIPSGTYSFFTIPDRDEWTIILNKAVEMHGTSEYTPDKDLVRFKVKAEKSSRYYETFTIEVNDIIKDAASLFVIWENTQVKINIQTNADEVVMTEINNRINIKKEDRASLFYQASMYYFNNKKDIKQSYEWIKMANQKTQDAGYLQLQGKIEAAMGDKSNAIKSLKASTDLARAKKLDQIISANDKLLAELNK
jgi:hypothetical protein